jgi:hypothetical protein
MWNMMPIKRKGYKNQAGCKDLQGAHIKHENQLARVGVVGV